MRHGWSGDGGNIIYCFLCWCYFPNQWRIPLFYDVFHQEMKTHGMNGKAVIALVKRPSAWGWACQSIQQRGLYAMLTSAAKTRESGGEEETDGWGKQNPCSADSVLFLTQIKTQASWAFVYMTTYNHEHCLHFPVQNNRVGKLIINERRKRHTENRHRSFPYSTANEVVSRMLRWTAMAKRL